MALELLVSAATEAIFGYLLDKTDLGTRLQSYLGRDPDKVAFKLALTRTLNNLTREHPTWVKDLFDEPFLTGGAALLLARYLQPSAPEPTGAELAEAWAAQLNLSPARAAKYADQATAVSSYFLARLKHHLRDQKPLWDLLLMRDVGDMAGQVSSVQLDIAALRTELAQSLTQWQQSAATGGVTISDLTDSNLTIIGHIAGRDLYIIQQAPHRRACPTPPAQPAVFGGRDDELEAVKAALREGKDSAITALTGGGGIGKTTLAKQVAHDLHSEKVFRAVLWAEVNQAPDPTQLLLEWGKLAEEKFESKNRSTPALAHAVRDLLTDLISKECPTCEGNRVLVVLDNVWSDGRDAYIHLRDAVPANSTILLTSRAEAVPIALSIPHHYSLDYLHPEAGADFLAKYLPTAPREGLLELADLLGGYPLAMELAASRVKLIVGDAGMDTPRALARATQNYREGIPSDHSFADLHLEVGEQKERNLTLSLSYSYNDLAPDDQRRFRQLGVLPLDTDFDLMLLGELWEEEDRNKVEDYCRTLRVAALISSTDEEGWYRQHRLLRAYARALLNREDEFSETAEHGMKALNLMGQIRDRWGYKRLALTYFEEVLSLASKLENPKWRVNSLNSIGLIWLDLGQKYQALDYYNQALLLLSSVEDIGAILVTLNNIGGVWDTLGEKRKALQYFEQILPSVRAIKDINGEAVTLHNIGGVWAALGEKRKALPYFEQALLLRQKIDDKEGESTTLNNIAGVWSSLGEKRKALEYYEQALLIRRVERNKGGEGQTLNSIGKVWSDLGDKVKALEYYEAALPLLREVEDREAEALTLNNIGRVWDDLHEMDKAMEYYQQALIFLNAIEDKAGKALVLNNIGSVKSVLGEREEALVYFEEALFIRQALEDKVGEAATLNNIGRVWDDLGKKGQALEYYHQALVLTQIVEDRRGEAVTCYNMGMVYRDLGDLDKAIDYVARCVELDKQIEHPDLESDRRVLAELQRRKAGGEPPSTSLPSETLQILASNTVAVCTEVPDKREEWQSNLNEIRADFAANGDDWANEVALVDALLAILAGNDGTLPPANPYAGLISQIYAEIEAYHNRSEDEGE